MIRGSPDPFPIFEGGVRLRQMACAHALTGLRPPGRERARGTVHDVICGIRSEERHRVSKRVGVAARLLPRMWAWPHAFTRVCGRTHTPAVKVSAVKSRKKTCVSVIALHLILCPS